MPQPDDRRGRRAARHNRQRFPPKRRRQRWSCVRDATAPDFGTFYGLDALVRAYGSQWGVFAYAGEHDEQGRLVFTRDNPAAAMAAWDSHVREHGHERDTRPGPPGTDEEEPPRSTP